CSRRRADVGSGPHPRRLPMPTRDAVLDRQPKLLDQLPSRLHHHAYVVKDHEANRHFIADVLGIPLVATWCDKTSSPSTGEQIEFGHSFFAMGDGSALAFFQFADPKFYQKCIAEKPAEIGFFDHIAFKVDDPTYDQLKGRLTANGLEYRERDHGYCKSIYA